MFSSAMAITARFQPGAERAAANLSCEVVDIGKRRIEKTFGLPWSDLQKAAVALNTVAPVIIRTHTGPLLIRFFEMPAKNRCTQVNA